MAMEVRTFVGGSASPRHAIGTGPLAKGAAVVATSALGMVAPFVAAPAASAAYTPPGCATAATDAWTANCWVSGTGITAGPYVAAVQSVLRSEFLYSGCMDGIWGPTTEAAVKSFQANNGLTADGIVGSATWGALHSDLAYRWRVSTSFGYIESYSSGYYNFQPNSTALIGFERNTDSYSNYLSWWTIQLNSGPSQCNTGSGYKQMQS